VTFRALAAGVVALMPDDDVASHVGEVDEPSPALPWRLVSVQVPGVLERSRVSTPHARTCRVRVTIAARTQDEALAVADSTLGALEGSRPAAAGWVTGPLQLRGDPAVYPTDVVLGGMTRHVFAAELPLVFAAQRQP